MRRLTTTVAATAALAATLLGTAAPALACAGLIGSNGAVNLGRTTTLAAYHDGVEHYVTAFKFLGGGGQFGTLIPLPDVPSNIERGGGWTLQRLALETEPPRPLSASRPTAASASGAEVLQQVRIDALDLTVLKGGGADVAVWAKEHGFRLSPDAPEVLDHYAQRSPIFLAAVFDSEAADARGQALGDGTPIHLTIPTAHPWVPLRILGLGKQPEDRINADVFLLTAAEPTLLPGPQEGLRLAHSRPARTALLDDLRSDVGMEWVPDAAWLTQLRIDETAGALKYDLAVDAPQPDVASPGLRSLAPTVAGGAGLAVLGLAGLPALVRRRRDRTGTQPNP